MPDVLGHIDVNWRCKTVVDWFGRTRILQRTSLNGSSTLKAVVDRALFAPSGGRQMAAGRQRADDFE